MDRKTNIGIFGIGAIGSVISTILSKNEGLSLYYYNRSYKNTINVLFEGITSEIPIQLQQTERRNVTLDYLIICIKEHHYLDALETLGRIITTTTKVVVIRNGLRLKEPILAFTDTSNILECIIDCPSQPTSDGHYLQLRKPILSMLESPLSIKFAQLLITNDIDIQLTKDFKTESWKKLVESASLGAILCVHSTTCSILQDINIQLQYKDLLDEAIVIAKADGAKIDNEFTLNSFQKIMKYPANKGSSMLTDRLQHRPIELNAKNGIIEKLGVFYNIETPLHSYYCKLIRDLNDHITIDQNNI